MITVFKQPQVVSKSSQWYTTGYISPPQRYPGIRADRQWQDMKTLARQAFAIPEKTPGKKEQFSKVISISRNR